MRIEIDPQVRVTAEGGRAQIARALDAARLTKAREAWLDNSSRMFDDDPDSDWIGGIPVASMAELVAVVKALPARGIGLEIEGEAHGAGLRVWMEGVPGRTVQMKGAEWTAKPEVFADKIRAGALKARQALDEALEMCAETP